MHPHTWNGRPYSIPEHYEYNLSIAISSTVTLMAEEIGKVTSTNHMGKTGSLQWYQPTYGQSGMSSWIGYIQQLLGRALKRGESETMPPIISLVPFWVLFLGEQGLKPNYPIIAQLR